VVSRVVRISTVFLVLVRPEVRVDDLTNPLDVHDLLHRLSGGIYSDQVVAGLDEIPGPTTAESAAAAPALTATSGATDRSFGGAQIHLAGRSASTLSSSTAARKPTARLQTLAEST
jgi:hypothetical protein